MIPAGALVLLDTDVLLRLVREDATGRHITSTYKLLERPDRPLLSIVSVGEILTFPRRREWGTAKVEILNSLLRELVIVPVSGHAIADQFAQITAFCQGKGRTLSDNDRWIAATACNTKAVLLTTDPDFDVLDPTFVQLVRVQLPAGPHT